MKAPLLKRIASFAVIVALAGCQSAPGVQKSSGGYVLMVAVDASGSVAYQVRERGFPSQQDCERRMHEVENSQDIVLRCVTASEAL